METFKKHLLGGHVADYMKSMKEADKEKYEHHFSKAVKAGVKAEDVEKMYKKVHTAIRKDPTMKRKAKKVPAVKKVSKRGVRVSRAQRRARAKQIIANHLKKDE